MSAFHPQCNETKLLRDPATFLILGIFFSNANPVQGQQATQSKGGYSVVLYRRKKKQEI